MEQEIKQMIAKHYKHAVGHGVDADVDGTISLNVENVPMAWLAKRLLDKYKDVYWIRFVGGWDTWVYSRETLKWAGYYGK